MPTSLPSLFPPTKVETPKKAQPDFSSAQSVARDRAVARRHSEFQSHLPGEVRNPAQGRGKPEAGSKGPEAAGEPGRAAKSSQAGGAVEPRGRTQSAQSRAAHSEKVQRKQADRVAAQKSDAAKEARSDQVKDGELKERLVQLARQVFAERVDANLYEGSPAVQVGALEEDFAAAYAHNEGETSGFLEFLAEAAKLIEAESPQAEEVTDEAEPGAAEASPDEEGAPAIVLAQGDVTPALLAAEAAAPSGEATIQSAPGEAEAALLTQTAPGAAAEAGAGKSAEGTDAIDADQPGRAALSPAQQARAALELAKANSEAGAEATAGEEAAAATGAAVEAEGGEGILPVDSLGKPTGVLRAQAAAAAAGLPPGTNNPTGIAEANPANGGVAPKSAVPAVGAAGEKPAGETRPRAEASVADANLAEARPGDRAEAAPRNAAQNFAALVQDLAQAQGLTHRSGNLVGSLDRALAQAPAQGAGSEALRPTPLPLLPVEIGLHAARGASRFQIRLDPVELGRVDVRLEIKDNGEVNANLVVDRVETLALLKRDASTLQQAFEQAGLRQSADGLTFTLRQDQPQQQGQERTPSRPVLPFQDEESLKLQNQISEIAIRRVLIPHSSIDRVI